MFSLTTAHRIVNPDKVSVYALIEAIQFPILTKAEIMVIPNLMLMKIGKNIIK
jgi:hypothetical protein